ncbi:MAG TPA: hypothetical protein PLP88_06480, partial [Bacteroidales bacterium]|nr:hypothetical protein [Bacteroidales bacterium]
TTSTVFNRSTFGLVPSTVSPSDESGIYILTLTSEEMEDVFEMSMTYREISFTECTVLYMAAKYCQAIITVDPCMRRIAGKLDMVVYDYEWLLKQMADSGVISTTTARDKLNELKTKVNPALLRDLRTGISLRLQSVEETRG